MAPQDRPLAELDLTAQVPSLCNDDWQQHVACRLSHAHCFDGEVLTNNPCSTTQTLLTASHPVDLCSLQFAQL